MEQQWNFVIPKRDSKQTIQKSKSLDIMEGLARKHWDALAFVSFKLGLLRIYELMALFAGYAIY